MPPTNPDYNSWGHGDYLSGGGGDVGDGCFPGSGDNNHQSTEWRMDLPAQQAETSASLALAKPQNKERKDQSEVSIIFYHARNSAL